ncbi:MAG: DUF4403 family protein, partial [Planctomycetota bacterium]|nr:DUF4403 family protein [Planctomycetota bacterium]
MKPRTTTLIDRKSKSLMTMSLGCVLVSAIATPAVMAQNKGKPAASHISLPVSLPMNSIQNTAEEVLGGGPKGRIYFVTGQDIGKGALRGKLEVEVRRNGAIQISPFPDGKGLEILLPIYTKARVDWKAGNRLLRIKKHKETYGTLTLKVRVSLNVAPDWSLKVVHTIQHQWTKKPSVSLGPFSVRIATRAGKEIDKLTKKLQKQVDEQILTKLNLKKSVGESWPQLFNQFQVTNQPAVYMSSAPVALNFKVVANQKSLSVVLALSIRLGAQVGEPLPCPALRPLPGAVAIPVKDGELTLKIPVTFPMKYAIANYFRSLPANSDIDALNFENMTVTGKGSRLAIDIPGYRKDLALKARAKVNLTLPHCVKIT